MIFNSVPNTGFTPSSTCMLRPERRTWIGIAISVSAPFSSSLFFLSIIRPASPESYTWCSGTDVESYCDSLCRDEQVSTRRCSGISKISRIGRWGSGSIWPKYVHFLLPQSLLFTNPPDSPSSIGHDRRRTRHRSPRRSTTKTTPG